MKGKIIIFAPHPDDETLGCGGTIAKKIAEGYDVFIVIVTDGRFLLLKGEGIDANPTPEQVKEIRRAEVLRATKILGVPEENVFFLDFTDGTLGENEKVAEGNVAMILEKFPPEEVYFPYEKDGHPDHQATNRVIKTAIRKLGLTSKMYKYSIAQKFARFGPFIDSFLCIFKRNRVHIDISEFLSLKKEAVKEFKTELSTISPRQSKPHTKDFNKFLRKKETFYIDK